MSADSDPSSTIISTLEGAADLSGIHGHVSSFLRPLSDVVPLDHPNKAQKKKTSKPPDTSLLHPLTKRFLPFISRALNLVPSALRKRLAAPSDDPTRADDAAELLDTYRLVLTCLQCIYPCLVGTPLMMPLHRVRFARALEDWGRYTEADEEVEGILDSLLSLRSSGTRKRGGKGGENYLPMPAEDASEDPELVGLLLNVVAVVVGCTYKRKCTDEAAYGRVMAMCEELQPWMRFLEEDLKNHRAVFAHALYSCLLFIVGECTHFDSAFVRRFCVLMLKEWQNSSRVDELPKVVRGICSSLDSKNGSNSYIIPDLLKFCLDSILCQCKANNLLLSSCSCFQETGYIPDGMVYFVPVFDSVDNINTVYNVTEFFETVCYVAKAISGLEISIDASNILLEFSSSEQVLSPVTSILNLYAISLKFLSSNYTHRSSAAAAATVTSCSINGSRCGSLTSYSMDFNLLARSLDFLDCHFHVAEDMLVSSNISANSFVDKLSSCQASLCKKRHGKVLLLSYFSSLEFLCKPLEDLVTEGWKQMVCQESIVHFCPNVAYIQDALHQFSDLYFHISDFANENEKLAERLRLSRVLLIHVAIAALKLSLGTGRLLQKSVACVKNLVLSKWINSEDLKYVSSLLYNIGASLNNIKKGCEVVTMLMLQVFSLSESASQTFSSCSLLASFENYVNKLIQASVALKLCCSALWTHVKFLCQVEFKIKDTCIVGPCENATKDVADAIAKSASSLDVLHRSRDTDLQSFMVECLSGWIVAEDTLNSTCPKNLVRQWVKITCREFGDIYAVEHVLPLSSLLSVHGKLASKRSACKILEQELSGYEEMIARNPNLCKKMQEKIIDILLDLYVGKEYLLQRARILVKKGKVSRASGIEGLNKCIQCLSEAISLFDGESFAKFDCDASSCHQLAITYCLRAQCVEEADHDLKPVLHDICAALELWSSVNFSALSSPGGNLDLMDWNVIQLLCNISDLMSLKGCLEIQFKVAKLITVFWQLVECQLENYFSMLWTAQRLNHAFCLSPINDFFFEYVGQSLGVGVNSVDFWLSCLKDSPATVISLLQKLLLSDSILPQLQFYIPERYSINKLTVEEVEAVASSLISGVAVSSNSAFLASHLYYDLSERITLGGKYSEALKFAKESLRLRKKMLQMQFIYLVKQQSEDEAFDRKTWDGNHHLHLEVLGAEITKDWPGSPAPQNSEKLIISPWNVLRCYLESTLQVGSILDLIGDGTEAEMFFSIGKKISDLQGLPLCKVYFKSQLGKVYTKKQLWEVAQIELKDAMLALQENDSVISCKCCKLTAEATLDIFHGDLYRFSAENSWKGFTKSASTPLSSYRSSLEKLTCASLNGHLKICKESKNLSGELGKVDSRQHILTRMESRSFSCCNCSGYDDSHDDSSHDRELKDGLANTCSLKVKGKDMKRAKRKCRNTKRIGEEESKENSEVIEKEYNLTLDKSAFHATIFPDYQKTCCETNYSRALTDCLACSFVKATVLGSMQVLAHWKWDCHRRRLILKVLSGIAHCQSIDDGEHTMHDVFLQSLFMIFKEDPYSPTACLVHNASLLKYMDGVLLKDTFPIERAVVLHDISFYFLKHHLSDNFRTNCCCLSDIQLSTIFQWLLRAFILANELPLLFQKVAQLLATLLVLSSLDENYALPLDFTKFLSKSHWAAYFHQASIGNHIYNQYLSVASEKNSDSSEESFLNMGSSLDSSISRIVPEQLLQLEVFVKNFFASLPNFTCICISFLAGDYISILGQALRLPSFVPAWMLLSRFDYKEQPLTVILPVDYITEEDRLEEMDLCHGSVANSDSVKAWECPWGNSVVDSVAPHFRLLLEENHLSLTNMPPASNDFLKSRSIWWSQRMRLDDRLSKLLRNMEDSWFGAWRCLLVGRRYDSQYLERVLTKLVDDLMCKCNFRAHENLLRFVADGSMSLSEAEICISQMCISEAEMLGECSRQFRVFPTDDIVSDSVLHLARSLMLEDIGKVHNESVDREPLVLILDADIQMLPWESFPVLRNQEVYRMPSLTCTITTLRRCSNEGLKEASDLPLVDPMDAYYVLNPSGDLSNTQAEFEEWFKLQKWEGNAGNAPTIDQLVIALQNHDLFIYIGHGSGTQYIPGHKISKLRKCGATLLMGCSSGCLYVKGHYSPRGAPLHYLFAGSPAIIANLWDVTDKDIDRFGKTILNFWLNEERESPSYDESIIANKESVKVGSSNKNSRSSKTRKVVPLPKSIQEPFRSVCRIIQKRERIASHMCQARDACKLSSLIGASPVCYGVPTLLRKKA